MSSARKRASIHKANNEADWQRQRAMRAEHHANVMQSFAEMAARKSDNYHAALSALRDVVIDQNRRGASWHPEVFASMMDALAKADALLTPNVLADRREPIGEASSPKGDGRAAG